MPSTYTSLHYHVVYSTKGRRRFIQTEWRERLHDYLGGAVRGLGGAPGQIGGVEDHVHMLFGRKPTACLADVVREIKKGATQWVHEKIGESELFWQEGYSAFTVSPTARDAVRGYIANQEEHHRAKSFQEELRELLELAGVEFDERFFD